MRSTPRPADAACLWSLFDQYNRRYFEGSIRPSEGFVLRYYRGVRLFGYFSYCRDTHIDWNITLSQRLRAHPRALRNTLVHEMIHMLAHQRYRETGESYYLDLTPIPGKPYLGKGHGAFFLDTMRQLNEQHPELGLSVVSHFGDHFYERDKILPVRLLIVHSARGPGKGMIYRLHPQAPTDWPALRETARELHNSDAIEVLQVAGAHAEGFPALRKDNAPRANMRVRTLRRFQPTLAMLKKAEGTIYLGDFCPIGDLPAVPAVLRAVG